MKRDTIELERSTGHVCGYSRIYFRFETYSEATLNALIQWSQGKNITIYHHLLRRGEENISQEKFYTPGFDPKMKIPYCELVTYLDIYYQEK